MITLRYFVVVLMLVTLFGCATPTETPPAETAITPGSKGPTLYTAKGCFSTMLNLAQRWSPEWTGRKGHGLARLFCVTQPGHDENRLLFGQPIADFSRARLQ
jgi:hypothetical protein